jgi:hypothetical protein
MNLTALAALVLIQYAMFCYWRPVTSIISSVVLGTYADHFYLGESLEESITHRLSTAYTFGRDALISIKNLNPTFQLGYISGRFSPTIELPSGSINIGTDNVLSLISNGGRMLLTVVFILSYLLQPVQRTILALAARIIESDKPVFTLLFGGIAAISKFMKILLDGFPASGH